MSRPEYQKAPFNPFIALAVGICAVSTGAIFARLADAPAIVIAAYRVGLAALLILPLSLWLVRSELRALLPRDLKLAILSGFFLAMHFATWISSLNYTSITNSVVLVNTNPLWVALFTPLITRERLGKRAMLSIFISVFGGIIIGAGDFALGGRALFGDFLALMGSICAAIYLLLGRNLRRKLSLLAYIQVCYGAAAVILWLMVLGAGFPVTGFTGGTWAAFWGMALIPQLIGHTSYNWSLRWFSTSLVAISLLGEPIGATILGYLVFGEGLTATKVIGGALILTAIYIASVGEEKRTGSKGEKRDGRERAEADSTG